MTTSATSSEAGPGRVRTWCSSASAAASPAIWTAARIARVGAEADFGAPFHALLLAGGKSSRMGRDKAAMRLGDQSLHDRALELLRALGPRRLLISGPGGVPDLVPDAGPPSGLYSTLHYLKEEEGLQGVPLLIIP